MLGNKITSNIDTAMSAGCVGVYSIGSNINYLAKNNTVKNMSFAFATDYHELKLLCNIIQNNSLAMFARNGAKLNMTTLLGAGYNDASNNNQFAKFENAGYWDPQLGYNSFKINNNTPCYDVTSGGPTHPTIRICPTITEGTLVNFNNFNTITNRYEQPAEQNYWLPVSAPVETEYNKVKKSSPGWTSAYDKVLAINPLLNVSGVSCPVVNGSGVSVLKSLVHPLDPTSLCSYINTPTFQNVRLQEALVQSMSYLSDSTSLINLNVATDLLTEILKFNFQVPIKNKVDNYLLELGYQKLFECVSQLVEANRDSGGVLSPMPSMLADKFIDLQLISDLRIERKSTSDNDYKMFIDLALLDKALISRLAENRPAAITHINTILANNPLQEQKKLFEHWNCIFTIEEDALNKIISAEDALASLKVCLNNYVNLQANNGRKSVNSENQNKEISLSDYAVSVYPNPTTGSLNIIYNLRQFKTITIDILDLQGKKIKSFTLSNQETQFNIENLNLENGVYIYSVIGDQKNILTKKIVIIK